MSHAWAAPLQGRLNLLACSGAPSPWTSLFWLQPVSCVSVKHVQGCCALCLLRKLEKPTD